jgi:cytochrome c oxidase subunit II
VLRSAAVTVGGALLLLPAEAAALTLTPDAPASPNAEDTQLAYIVMVIAAVLISLAVIGGLLGALRRGRAAGGEERRVRGTSGLQRRVGGGLAVIALAAFVFGVILTESATEVAPNGPDGLEVASLIEDAAAAEPPQTPAFAQPEPSADDPLRVLAAGQQWLWRYEYPDGTFSYHDLVVPVDTTVLLEVESTDVVHRWWVPALGPMTDATPGSSNEVWFKADEVGEYEGRSTEFSGPAYPTLRTRVVVLDQDEFRAWLEQQAGDIQDAQEAVQERVEDGTAPGVALQGGNADSAADPGSPGSGDGDGGGGAAGGASGEGTGGGQDSPGDEEASP